MDLSLPLPDRELLKFFVQSLMVWVEEEEGEEKEEEEGEERGEEKEGGEGEEEEE